MKTLIITVGTRQVGWRCQDGIVRSLGADGNRFDPQHIDEIYHQELGLKRDHHQDEDSDRTYPWSVWDLGHRLYQQCQKTNFSKVELLLDQIIIAEQVEQFLTHVLLWGTQQPEAVSWNYRRMDTVWLAELMAGKLRETYPNLQVIVFRNTLEAIDVNAIRDELELNILPFALKTRSPEDDQFTIIIENKGATPAIAEGLSICAGALVRDCQVVTMNPIEPKPLYPKISDTVQSVAPATEYRSVNLSSYFWPLERSRILSAWKRGDFAEAAIWLTAHRDRYQVLHDLAGHLALASNWQWHETLQVLKTWIEHPASTKSTNSKSTLKKWRASIQEQYRNQETPESKFLKIWESRLLIYLHLYRLNDTAAFLQFVQLIERLLFWRYKTEKWLDNGFLIPNDPEKAQKWSDYNASLGELIFAWRKVENVEETDPFLENLIWANRKRNGIVHDNKSINRRELTDFCNFSQDASNHQIYDALVQKVQRVSPRDRTMPEYSLFEDLYQWGLQQLQL